MTLTLDEHLKTLAVSDQALSKKALTVLSDLDPRTEALFRPTWERISLERRREIVHTLQMLAEDNVDLDFRQVFLFCLDDPDSTVRIMAVDSLWEDERISTLHRLRERINDPSSHVAAAALVSLSRFAYLAEMGELPEADANAVCTTLLDTAADTHQPLEVRRRAVEGLGYFADSPEAQAEIVRTYEHPAQEMRESALVAMGRSMRSNWLPYIEGELSSTEPALRYEAARAAGEFADEGTTLLPKVARLVVDSDIEVSLAAIWALGQIGGPEAQRILTRLIMSGDAARAEAAQEALEEALLGELGADDLNWMN